MDLKKSLDMHAWRRIIFKCLTEVMHALAQKALEFIQESKLNILRQMETPPLSGSHTSLVLEGGNL